MKKIFNLKNTRIVLISVLVFLIIWGIASQLLGGTDATISNAMTLFVHQQPWIFILGAYVFGHISWRMEPTAEMVLLWEKLGKPTARDIPKIIEKVNKNEH